MGSSQVPAPLRRRREPPRSLGSCSSPVPSAPESPRVNPRGSSWGCSPSARPHALPTAERAPAPASPPAATGARPLSKGHCTSQRRWQAEPTVPRDTSAARPARAGHASLPAAAGCLLFCPRRLSLLRETRLGFTLLRSTSLHPLETRSSVPSLLSSSGLAAFAAATTTHPPSFEGGSAGWPLSPPRCARFPRVGPAGAPRYPPCSPAHFFTAPLRCRGGGGRGGGQEGSVWPRVQRAGWHGCGEAWLSEVIQANGSLATRRPQWERRRRNVSTCLINGSKGDSKANRSWERDTKRKQPFLCSVPFICHSSLCG